MKKRTIALAILSAAWLCLTVPVTRADIGGNIPGPGLCDYPGVGSSGNVMGGNWFYCDFPIEINGSHRHCAYGIFVPGGLGGNGPNFAGSLGLQIGGRRKLLLGLPGPDPGRTTQPARRLEEQDHPGKMQDGRGGADNPWPGTFGVAYTAAGTTGTRGDQSRYPQPPRDRKPVMRD